MTDRDVRRDGMREAVTKLRDKWNGMRCGVLGPGLRKAADDLLTALEQGHIEGGLVTDADPRGPRLVFDAVPDVPPTNPASLMGVPDDNDDDFSDLYVDDDEDDVPPDPPAADREQLAREMAAGFHGGGVWESSLNEGQRRVWLNIADRVFASGVLVDAADVRARALEDVRTRLLVASAKAGEAGQHEYEAFVNRMLVAAGLDRAVSERDRRTT